MDNSQLRKTHSILPRILLAVCLFSIWILLFLSHHNHLSKLKSSSSQHEYRRRLDWSSNCPPNLLSTIPNPTLPTTPILKRPSYLASFPGSGDKIFSKYLVEMISGLSVGEAAVSPSLYKMEQLAGSSSSFGGGGQGEVFGVKTHFPHTSGKLASWDSEIPLAIVILRNPIHAIPSYFNEVYELRNHLPAGSSKDPQHQQDTHALWLKWRDNQLPSQIMLYRRFVSFWMERHIEDDNNRIFFTYEDLVEYYKGPADSKRLHQFIARALKDNIEEMVKSGEVKGVTVNEKDTIDALVKDATKNLVAEEVAPCVWKELVAPASTQNRRLQSTDPPYSSSIGGDWDAAERPLSPENLAALSQMLLELMNRWSRHQRLLNIIAGYHRDVNKLYLEAAGKRDEGQQQGFDRQPSNRNDETQTFADPKLSKNFHIIQVSPPRAYRTTSINWLMGLFAPFSDYASMTGSWPDDPIQQSGKDVNIEAHLVTTSHDLDILKMYKRMRPLFDEVFFILSFEVSDLGTTISEELCQYKNVMCVPNDEFMFSGLEELRVMVSKLTTKLKARFAYFFGTEEWLTEKDEINCYRRLQDMLRAKLDMADQPAEKLDQKFGIRGGGKKRCPPSLVTC